MGKERERERERPPRLLKGLFELVLFLQAAKWRQSNVRLTASSLKPPPHLPLKSKKTDGIKVAPSPTLKCQSFSFFLLNTASLLYSGM